MSEEKKLSKKERKALEFKKNKSKEEREEEKVERERAKVEKKRKREEEEADKKASEEAQPKKKRKTRRGKKGKGINGGTGPRFILFVGNLSYSTTEEMLRAHFKKCPPNRIRVRPDKGIAFLEFDNDTDAIRKKMDLALALHHSMMDNRKINVELTVGGGGNSEKRLQKLKDKNDKLGEERKERVEKTKKEESAKRAAKAAAESKNSGSNSNSSSANVHPSRLGMIQD
ncbi:uncharacterized protein KQ657_005150 [Scheffersomyces spartinae]|uniref:RRM domain-containing protein n=1 Tax=Scheffersomyces spartinae TaxID=45513 RepID=A0A9P8AIP5_9ASCO|nr:uncharacterized protein KQ657_005150 [Scheffersomyces spartinae]KAG7193951.1 hypothetical protein KQ657_005150 [Scheffersomyces spartinae]